MHSGDPPLRCNLLTCRRAISALANDHAIVTTCSHVFCEACATAAFSAALVCPACETPLPEPEDIALTTLNPSERYKSSVLSGLPPTVIHDIAGRALSFWVYQITQEAEARVQESESRANAIAAQTNQELAVLRDQLQALEHDRELDRRRVHDLAEQCAEKSRELARLQVQMDHLRRKSIVPRATGGGGSGETLTNVDPFPQRAPVDAAGRVGQAVSGNSTARLPANGPVGGMHWTATAAGSTEHGPSAAPPAAASWRPWNATGTTRDGAAAVSNGIHQHQLHRTDRSVRHGSVIHNPVVTAGATGAGGGISTPRSGRSVLMPSIPHPTPPPPRMTTGNTNGQRNAAVEWMQQQAPPQRQHAHMPQQGPSQQQQCHGQTSVHGYAHRRSFRKSGGRNQTNR
ncbi:hypothetical protein BCR44DRAFT_1436067 [Catenaria anguillulae PL171]|uniref:RING-type domain-containing protein n=1 Tax=Catenaria anguillulae PL171 TaxID=765915 RepID=A0A1Y2HLP0_9FUNG|nr:hypothetical protein BCR44DRAFT_1436067 [Catenaria anguillulae PL171]